ncbi:MAG TPA: LuxR family transcriptional regulator [Sporichthyaceae bacterium]|nr:LuxR family transcriptional regulator [Sporichthyaceae bacterium]
MSAGALVGRGEELDFVRAALADPGVGAVVLAGEAGVGKTRLAREALSAAQRSGETTFWVAGSVATEAIPFGAVTHLLPAVEAGGDRFAVLQAVTRYLASMGRRPVVGVDDAHRLDEASAALVYHVAVTRAAFIVATVRTGEPAPGQVGGLWKDGIGERVEVQPLGRREAAALVSALVGGPVDAVTEEQLWRLTHGNALYLRELVMGGRDAAKWVVRDGVWTWPGRVDAPGRIVELIADRIDRQPESVRELVELVAFGEPLGVAVLEAAGVTTATIAAAEAAALVRTEVSRRDVQVRLSHPLFGEVARARCSALRRREASRVLARASAGIDRPEDVLRSALWHLDGGVEIPAEVLLAAGARARGVLDLPLAQRMAAAAVDAGGGLVAEGQLASALILCGQCEDAEVLLAGLLDRDLPDLVRAEFAALRAWNLSDGLGRPADAEVALTAVAEVLTEGHHVIACERSHLSVTGGRPAEGCAAATEVIDGPSVPRPEVMLRALISRSWCLALMGRYQECRLDAGRAEALHRQIHGAVWTQSWEELLSAGWFGHFHAGDLDTAEAVLDRELGLKRAAGWRVGTAWWTAWKGAALLARGTVRSALEELRAGMILLAHETHPHRRLTGRLMRLHQAVVASMLGELDEADFALNRADEFAGAQIAATDVRGGCAHAWVAVAHGDLDRGIELAMAAGDQGRDTGLYGWEILARHQVVRFGAPQRVLDRLEELAGLVEGHLAPLYTAHAHALAEQDGAGLEGVAAGFAGLGYGLLAAEAEAQAARAHHRGHTGEASNAAVRARALAARCQGAQTPALALLTEPAERLTPRESEIARLAATGLTNHAIADRLVISPRTVDNTLAKVYLKLGINSRDGLDLLFT